MEPSDPVWLLRSVDVMSQSDVIAAANESARRLGVGAFLYRLDPSPRATKDVTDGIVSTSRVVPGGKPSLGLPGPRYPGGGPLPGGPPSLCLLLCSSLSALGGPLRER